MYFFTCAVLLIVSISFVGLAICLIIIFVGIGCARRLAKRFCPSHIAPFPLISFSHEGTIWSMAFMVLLCHSPSRLTEMTFKAIIKVIDKFNDTVQ